MIGIYLIRNKADNNKCYVGSSRNIEDRIKNHKLRIASGVHHVFSKEICNTGDFEFEVLLKLGSELHLQLFENYFIGLYNSIEQGYNKELSFRFPRLVIDGFKRVPDSLCTREEISSLLKLSNEEADVFFSDRNIPHILICKSIMRYNSADVLNWVLGKSESVDLKNRFSSSFENGILANVRKA